MAMVSALATRVLGRVAIAIALLALSACVPTASPAGSTANAPIAVLGTENFYADLLAQIGGTRVIASSILNDPAADPHEYEASPATAKVVADSKLVIVNGIGYDDFMEKVLCASTKPDRVVINVQELLGAKDDVNVHVWYDPATMPKVADAATAALARLDPQNAAYFSAQKAKYLVALKPLNDKIASIKAKYTGAPIAFTENVAGYLTDAMGLKVLTPPAFMEAIESGTDPAPAASGATCRSTSRPAPSSRSSDRTGPERHRSCAPSSAWSSPPPDGSTCWGMRRIGATLASAMSRSTRASTPSSPSAGVTSSV